MSSLACASGWLLGEVVYAWLVVLVKSVLYKAISMNDIQRTRTSRTPG